MSDDSNRIEKFKLPFWAWILMFLLLISVYFELIDIVRAIKGIENSEKKGINPIFLNSFFVLPVLKIMGLSFLYKGKKIGLWFLGGTYLVSALFQYMSTGTFNYLSLIVGYGILLIFRLAIIK